MPADPQSTVWSRALRAATSALDAGEAVARVLAEAVDGLGAEAGAVLEGDLLRRREEWGSAAAELDAILAPGGPVQQATAAGSEAAEPPPIPTAAGIVLLARLRLRGQSLGWLLLLFRDAPPPEAPQALASFAGLLSLLLENDRLSESARAADQARDHFLTALNHELRTPATAFALTIDLVRSEAESKLPPRVDKLLRDAEAHLEHVMAVLRRVLDLGQVGQQSGPQREDLVQPRDVVAQLLRRVEPHAKRKNLSLALFVPRGLPPLQTDESRMTRVLLHLLGNAVKYTAQGSIEVRLERVVQRLTGARPEPALAIRVRDTGRGIPAEQLQRVFEPFTQVDEGSRTDSRTRGLGLGLPLARQLARSLGGDVVLESVPDRGTTATLLLPYHRT